jgi:asparagine synthetase B (glutamine-hydrolysing)
MLALELLKKPFLAYHVKTTSDNYTIVQDRVNYCRFAQGTVIHAHNKTLREKKKWLEERCERFRYKTANSGRRAFYVTDDKASLGLSLILDQVRQRGGLIYLSGSGADETISDYAMNGKAIYPHSSFNGIFPVNLESIFPWKSFYGGTQRDYLMKEELTGGVHGIETRYPFLDPFVVQEYLWLRADVKNSEYKKPLADFMRAANFPNMYNVKAGFAPKVHDKFHTVNNSISNATFPEAVFIELNLQQSETRTAFPIQIETGFVLIATLLVSVLLLTQRSLRRALRTIRAYLNTVR